MSEQDQINNYIELDTKIDEFNEKANKPFEMTRKTALKIISKEDIVTVLKTKLVKKSVDLNDLSTTFLNEYLERRRLAIQKRLTSGNNVISTICSNVVYIWATDFEQKGNEENSVLQAQKIETICKLFDAKENDEQTKEYIQDVSKILTFFLDKTAKTKDKKIDIKQELKKMFEDTFL